MSQTGNFTTISAAIVSVLEGIQQAESSAFAGVYNYPTIQSSAGNPFATVAPSDSPSNYLNIAQNLRNYTFQVDLYYAIEADSEGYSTAFSNMMVLVESCLDAIDNSNSLNGTAQIVKPAPSVWGVVQASPGPLLTARINVVACVSVPQSNG